VKPILACLLLLAPVARGQIFADVSTTMGDFTIQLDHLNSPLTVANFMCLSEGSAPWVHHKTGLVHYDTPFYNGVSFHRVIAGFMCQSGSPRGDGTDGPGYFFRDEADNGVSHARHSISMANSGPHSNGSQFFITDVVTDWLDGIHAVFGAISAGGAVVDAINAVPTTDDEPDTPVLINLITIRRVGATAMAFDEHAQGLPLVTAPEVTVQHDGSGATLAFTQPARSVATCFYSSDAETWEWLQRYVAPTSPIKNSLDMTPETIGRARQFFATSIVTFGPDAIFPDSILNRTLTTLITGTGTITFTFDGQGGGSYTTDFGSPPGTITSYEFYPDGIGTWLVIYTSGLVPLRYRLGHDTDDASMFFGRHTGTAFASPSSFGIDGTFTLTR